jgi:hypothetical protein
MNIYYIREFWFDDFYEGNGNVQRAFINWTDFNQQNIKVTAQLNVFGPGAYIAEDNNGITGGLGFAAVGVKSYDYIDDRGNPQHVDNSYFVPHATIHKCVGIQLELAFRRAWVGATGAIYYFTD